MVNMMHTHMHNEQHFLSYLAEGSVDRLGVLGVRMGPKTKLTVPKTYNELTMAWAKTFAQKVQKNCRQYEHFFSEPEKILE